MQRRRFALTAVLTTALVALGLLSAAPSSATVGVRAAAWTPSVGANSTVWKMQQCGNIMFAVGSFSKVTQGGHTYARKNAFSFNAKTGKLTSWNPSVYGPVYGLAVSKNCAIAYVGGTFKKIGHRYAHNIAAISTRSGYLYTPFRRSASATVRTLMLVNKGTQLLAGGYFTFINGSATRYYVSLNRLTGRKTSYLKAAVSGKISNASKGHSMVYNQQLSRSGKALLLEGDFTTVGRHRHVQIAELMIRPSGATVSSWTQKTINAKTCTAIPFYIRAAAFSPDQRTIYIATTGLSGTSPYCDAVVAFANTSTAKAKWVNKTGHDSLYTVAAGRSTVYVGGHERWANNPHGHDTCGKGCVSRPGVGAVSATSGKATRWNPTRSRGHGADDMLITSKGLWIASDTFYNSNLCAHARHGGICLLSGSA